MVYLLFKPNKKGMSKQLFDFDDILIQPADMTHIDSRSEISPRYGNFLPLMTAPMDTVVNEENKEIFRVLGIEVVLPRISNPDNNYISNNEFLSYSLTDFERIFLDRTPKRTGQKMYALIDVANGHMENVYEFAKSAKIRYDDDLILMVGNVANPDTYHKFASINVDYVRIGIGNGAGCLTTQQTGIGYPMASLIEECGNIQTKKHYMGNCNPFETKIVADGGFQKYSDVIKALALGADYVMLGSIFNKALESAGETICGTETVNQYSIDALKMFNADMELTKVFRGMSTKEVQRDWGKDKLTTSEGVVRRHKVEYTLAQWVDNFEDYLKSAMSYTDKKTLPEFIGKVDYNFITMNSLKRFSK
jgi:IMP dehydrogenase/GMP reductase